MNLIFSFMLSYAGVIFVFYMLFNFMSNGFLGTFIRIKMSRGGLTLVEVIGVTNTYYRAGKFDGVVLRYKSANKKKKRMVIPEGVLPSEIIFRRLGQPSVTVNEELNCWLTRDFNGVVGFDAEQFDNICTRLATLPEIQVDKKEVAILIIGILSLLILIFVAYKTNSLAPLIESIKSTIGGTIN